MNPSNGQDRLFNRLLAGAFVLTLGFGLLIAHYYTDLGNRPVATGMSGAGTGGQGPGSDTAGQEAATSAETPGTTGGQATTTAAAGAKAGTTKTTTKAGAAASSAGVSRGSIKVGGIFTETGPFDARPADQSVRAYFQMINAEGGVNGRTLEYISYDDGFDPTQGQNAARRLVEQDKVFAIVGWLAPNSEPAASEYFAKIGIPVIGGLAVPQEFGPRNFFATMANLGKAGAGVARFLCEGGVKKPAIGVVNLPFSTQMIASVKKGLAQCGITPVTADAIDSTEAGWDAKILDWRRKGADSIGVALDPMSYVRLFQALAKQGWHPPTWTVGAADTERNAYVKGALEGVINVESQLVPAVHMNLPGPRRYVETLHKYYPGVTIASDAEISWTAAQVFVEALRRVGPDLTREKLIDTLETFREFKTDVSAPITYLPGDHDAVRCIELLQWKNGGWTDVYPDFQCWDYTPDGGAVKRPSKPFG
ncbi:MAG: ABC transporter substrate-binding protein [Actinomycetota bacterium]